MLQDRILLLKIPVGTRKNLFEIYWHALSKSLANSVLTSVQRSVEEADCLMYLGYTALLLLLNHFPTTCLQLRTCSKSITNVGKRTLTKPTHFLHIQQCGTHESQHKVWYRYKSSTRYFGTVMSLSSKDSSYSLLCCCKDTESNRFPSVLLLLLLLLLLLICKYVVTSLRVFTAHLSNLAPWCFYLLTGKQYSYIMWSTATKYSGRYYVALRWPPVAQRSYQVSSKLITLKKKKQWHTQDNKLSVWRGRGEVIYPTNRQFSEANSFSASEELSTFYEIRRFITVFTTARHLSPSKARSI
jgi:hypothetical protein